eukprot:563368-Heterocapsa_arctica.AAC.1
MLSLAIISRGLSTQNALDLSSGLELLRLHLVRTSSILNKSALRALELLVIPQVAQIRHHVSGTFIIR